MKLNEIKKGDAFCAASLGVALVTAIVTSNWFAALGFGSAIILLCLLVMLGNAANECLELTKQAANQSAQLQRIVESQRKLIQKMLDRAMKSVE